MPASGIIDMGSDITIVSVKRFKQLKEEHANKQAFNYDKQGGYYSVDWTTGLTYFWFLHILRLLLLCLC